jgi:hypothetical protein
MRENDLGMAQPSPWCVVAFKKVEEASSCLVVGPFIPVSLLNLAGEKENIYILVYIYYI